MGPVELLRWQWEGYPCAHGNRVNLWLHIFTAPFYWLGTVLLVLGVVELRWPQLVLGLASMLVTLIAQGRGHKLEVNPPAPFTSPWNFLARLFLEQWINFPRFVLTGGWRRKLSAAQETG